MCKATVTIQDYNNLDIIEMTAETDDYEGSSEIEHLDYDVH